MIRQLSAGVVHVHPAGVGLNAGRIDIRGDGSPGIYLHHDLFVSVRSTELRQLDLGVVRDCVARSTIVIAVHACVHR